MANSHQATPPEVASRLVLGVERLLSSVGSRVTASFREARPVESLRELPGPIAVLTWQFGGGVSGSGALVLPGAIALALVRARSGEATDAASQAPRSEDEDALRVLAESVAREVASALGEILGKPVSLEAPSSEWLPAGGAGLPAWSEGVSLAVTLSVGEITAESSLVVPRAEMAAASAGPMAAEFPSLGESAGRRNGGGMEMLLDVSLPVTVELGRARMMIRDILHLAPGSVVELDKLAGEPVDILINEKSIARGEVVVIDENFGVRLTSIVTPSERVASLR